MSPRASAVAATLLWLLALASLLAGFLATWASNCCASRDPANPVPALAGLVVAGCLAGAAVALRAGGPSWLVLLLAAALPVACLLAAPHSMDLANAALLAVPAWGALAWMTLRR